MASPSVTYTFTNSTTADATQVNQNFTDLINAMSDGTKDHSIAALTAANTVTANGALVLNGNTTFGTGSFGSSLAFGANTSYDVGAATLGPRSIYLGGTSTFTLRLKAPTLSGSYTVTLPAAAPGSNQVLQMDSSGNITTRSVGQQISSSCSGFTTTSASFVDVTNLTVTITTTGRPVMVLLQSDGSGNLAFLSTSKSAATSLSNFKILRASTEIARYQIEASATGASATTNEVPASSILILDTPSAGTYTYKLQAQSGDSSTTTAVTWAVLVAYEL